MSFLKQTLLPQQDVSLLIVDARMYPNVKKKLEDYDTELIQIPVYCGIGAPVAGHPDMQILHIRDNILVCQPHLPEFLQEKLKKLGFDLYIGSTLLKKHYPLDIAYNVAIIGERAFHNTKYTDDVIKRLLCRFSIKLIHVNQGYTKCSVLPVSSQSIITDDPSIAKVAYQEGLEVLKIPPQTKIHLPGLNYGFIGGTAGFINKNTLAFVGDINSLDSKEEIKKFLNKYNLQWVNLGESQLYDYGGLIPIYEKP